MIYAFLILAAAVLYPAALATLWWLWLKWAWR